MKLESRLRKVAKEIVNLLEEKQKQTKVAKAEAVFNLLDEKFHWMINDGSDDYGPEVR